MNINKTPYAALSIPVAKAPAAARDGNNVAANSGNPAKAAASLPVATQDTVSLSKVAQMRAAIESGTFKIDAEKVADGILKSGDLNP